MSKAGSSLINANICISTPKFTKKMKTQFSELPSATS